MALAALSGLFLAACSDTIPTSGDPGLIPVDAETFVVELPWSAFGADFRVDGGYGSARDLPNAILSRVEEGDGHSRGLIRWTRFPAAVPVVLPGNETPVNDTIWTPVGGDLILRVDTARVIGGESFQIDVDRVLEPFDPATAGWVQAVDTVGDRRAWSTPGGGQRVRLGSTQWEPALGDSIFIPLDSATAVLLSDPDQAHRAVAVSTPDDGAYLRLFDAFLRLRVRPSLQPDSTRFLQPVNKEITFIHSGVVGDSDDRIAVGGVPAVRTSFRFELPASVTASGSVCGGPPTCQVELTADRVVYAGLLLTSVVPADPLLAPVDTISVDLRPVLAPQLLPRAPLGLPLQAAARRVPPSAFRDEPGRTVEIAVTRYFRDLIRGPEPGEDALTSTVSIMVASEPSGLGVATFGGPASAVPPRLRLILTRSAGVTLP
jgi:hypothetical protein